MQNIKQTAKIFTMIFVLFSSATHCTPAVSIITSVYDGDQFIEGFMQDIVQQTIFDQCELIIINANSPGNEEPIIKKYMQAHPNIIYVKLDQDPGLYGVWNRGIKMARGQYVTNANIDDRLAFNCYEQHKAALDTHPEIDLVYSDLYFTHKPNETFDNNTAYKKRIYPDFSPKFMKVCLPNNHPMWRKILHTKYGYFDESYKAVGDYEMWLRAVYGGAKFMKVNKILGLYYENPTGLSACWGLKERQRALRKYYALFKMKAYRNKNFSGE